MPAQLLAYEISLYQNSHPSYEKFSRLWIYDFILIVSYHSILEASLDSLSGVNYWGIFLKRRVISPRVVAVPLGRVLAIDLFYEDLFHIFIFQ
jgi:hypothetical protein